MLQSSQTIQVRSILQAQSYSVTCVAANLILVDPKTEEWFCTRCNIAYHPAKEKVKRPNRFITPGPEIDSHGNIIGDKMPLLSIVDNDREPSSIIRKPKLPKSFEGMQRHGVRITSYTTTEDS
jgi:hypothetical protein